MHVLEQATEVPDALAPYLAVDRSHPPHECWVTGHMVAGLDGTAAVGGRVGALSTAPDQELFRRMRQIADIVLVGAETVRLEGYGPVRLDEDAQEQRRQLGKSPTPPLAVVSRSLAFDWNATVFADAPDDAPTHLITCAAADPRRLAEAEQVATVIVAGDERVEPAAAMRALAELDRRVVLCEGGPTWLGELVAADRLDELCLSISPLMGGDPLPVSVTPPGAGIAAFELRGAMAEDNTLFLRYERAASGVVAVSDDAFDTLMASADPPLIVLTTVAEDERAGCLVGFHAQASIDPERYCIWLSKANHTYRVSLRAAHFAVHFLTSEDLPLAELFGTNSGEDTDKFAGVDVDLDDHGVPLLRACPNRMSLDRIALLDDGGDHVCLTTRVRSADTAGRFEPLRVSSAVHLDPGHEAEERAIDP